MTGWLGDFFRFWWALAYWNTRKTWFRLRGAHRDSCPCQNYSDSGLALDARCDAIIHWEKPARFRRVCPLLTLTKDGWRCGVDAERVRPFWGRALLFGTSLAAGAYLAGSVAVYAFLRSAHYEVRYATVVWPPRWKELRGSQESLHARRAQEALAAGNYPAALLSLQRVCELNPRNYSAARTLASLSQVSGQPSVAEHIYERLMIDVPEQRPATAEIWIRLLLARADYARIKPLALAMLTEDPARREPWLHCLLFAVRQTRDTATLDAVVQNHTGLPDWCVDLVRIELLLLQDRREQALILLSRASSHPGSRYVPLYHIDRLLDIGRLEEAGRLVEISSSVLPGDEAAFLRLRIFQARQWHSLKEAEYDNLLSYPMTPKLAAQFSAWLIREPDPQALASYLDRFLQDGPGLQSETLPVYHAAYLAATMGGDRARAGQIAEVISRFTQSDSKALRAVADVLPQASSPQIAQLLPLVPLPLEVIYAIWERTVKRADR